MTSVENIEVLLLKEFETVPFHNLFMLNNISKEPSLLGGTCSDKVLHFKKVLNYNGIVSKLHSAFINGFECHRMLSVEIDKQKYFIDVGSGWASTKLFPAFAPIEYSVYGFTFKTEILKDSILLYHKVHYEYKLMSTIPLLSKNEKSILDQVKSRFSDMTIYPFQKSLRFSKVKDKSFYSIKGDTLRIFNSNDFSQTILTEQEKCYMIQDVLGFNLQGLKMNFDKDR